MVLNWNPKTADRTVREILRTLGEEYPIQETAQQPNLIFERAEEESVLRVTRRGNSWIVNYGRDSLAARGVA